MSIMFDLADPGAQAKSNKSSHRIPLPPLPSEAIAQVLGSLDDKIELNRRMNKTLGMAQALFKGWLWT